MRCTHRTLTLLLSSLAFILSAPTYAAPGSDLVTDLPSYGPPPTPHYSGYLDASTAETGTRLHYWYAESSAPDASARPTVLWLNGGPGSSSLLGFLQEVGPLLINRTGGLMENPYAWTREANVFALESPAGVGYSYCSAMLDDGNGGCANTDNSTSAAALAALQDFFDNKFPELRSNPFYIVGESYAGVYIPTLALRILEYNAAQTTTTATKDKKIPLAGIATGDPCTDNESQHDSMDMIWYGHKYGFVPDPLFETLWNTCGYRSRPALTLGKIGPTIADEDDDDTNPQPDNDLADAAVADASETTTPVLLPRLRRLDGFPKTPECTAAEREFLFLTSYGFSQGWHLAYINDVTLYGPSALVAWDVPGSLNYHQAQYLMRDDVRKALHVTDAPQKEWPGPNDNWSYRKQWAACNDNVPPGTPSMVDLYRIIAPQLRSTLVFNGDTDPCVSYEGTRDAVAKINFPVTNGWRPWFYNATATTLSLLDTKPLLFGPGLGIENSGPQLGGHVVEYENNLSFATVHGSGHMVPQFRPRAALHMLRKFLKGETLSPKPPKEEELESMTVKEFKKFMDSWTEEAKSSKFVG